jgi:hypothetical protein
MGREFVIDLDCSEEEWMDFLTRFDETVNGEPDGERRVGMVQEAED